MNDMELRIDRLDRQLRRTRALLGGMLLAVGGAALIGAANRPSTAENAVVEELTVSRLNIAGEDGVNRIVLSSVMPTAPFDGVELERSVPSGLAGMIFCAPNGDEVGGIGVSGSPDGGHALFALDYRGIPLEAMGMVTKATSRGQSAHLIFMDNPGPDDSIDVQKLADKDDAEIKKLQALMVGRIQMGVEEREASLVFADSSGRTRIEISVAEDGSPALKFLDENGEELLRLPETPGHNAENGGP